MKTILITLAFAASGLLVQAQPEGGAPRPGGPDGPRRPVPPLFAALDADKDGELSADEIANAVTALKALDKNGDGKIGKEELRPPMPPRGEGEGRGDGKGDGKGEARPPRREGALNVSPQSDHGFGGHMNREGGAYFAGPGPVGPPRFEEPRRPEGGPAFQGRWHRGGPGGPLPAHRK